MVRGLWLGRRSWAVAVASMLLLLSACAGRSADATDEPDRSTEETAESPPRASPPERTDEPVETTRPQPTSTDALPGGRDVVVTSITDGDTFRAGDERVRLTGIDTPEVSGAVECFGREATAALDRLIPPGTQVRLVGDVGPVDRYGRSLAYVYRVEDGAFVNLELARQGYAQPLTVPPNVAHADDVAAAAAEARNAGRGLWSACADPDDPDPAATTPPATPEASTSSSSPTGGPPSPRTGDEGCDPAYPDGCIPPSPPDLGCGDITLRDFAVLAPDPHQFDGNGDGRGCEGG